MIAQALYLHDRIAYGFSVGESREALLVYAMSFIRITVQLQRDRRLYDLTVVRLMRTLWLSVKEMFAK